MNYAEPIAAKRRIPVYLVDSSGDPVTGVTPTGAEIRVCQSGELLVNASGTWTELSSGAYYYECTVLECTTLSYLLLCIEVSGVQTFVWVTDVGTRISAEESSPMRRHLPIYLTLAGVAVPGLALSGAEVQISKAGGAFYNGAGTIATVGSGVYDYEASSADVADVGPLVLKVDDAAADPYLYTMDVVDAESASDLGSSGYFGAYFGAASITVVAAPPPVIVPSPVESPYSASDPAYFDHVAHALARLCQYAKAKVSDAE